MLGFLESYILVLGWCLGYKVFLYLLLSFGYTFRQELMDVNMCLRHVMVDGCKWLLVVARGCMNTHQALDRLSHISYCICMNIYTCLWMELNVLSCGCCIWMDVCAHIQCLCDQDYLHTCWTHGTKHILHLEDQSGLIICIRQGTYTHTSCKCSHSIRNLLRTMNACD